VNGAEPPAERSVVALLPPCAGDVFARARSLNSCPSLKARDRRNVTHQEWQRCDAVWAIHWGTFRPRVFPVLYGIVPLMAAIAYHLLQQAIIRTQGEGSILKDAIGRDWKGKLSPVLYLFAVVATLRSSWIAQAVLVIAALIWLIPDQRIEKRLAVSGRLAIGPQ
jgi:hypothetical protein